MDLLTVVRPEKRVFPETAQSPPYPFTPLPPPYARAPRRITLINPTLAHLASTLSPSNGAGLPRGFIFARPQIQPHGRRDVMGGGFLRAWVQPVLMMHNGPATAGLASCPRCHESATRVLLAVR